MNPLSTMKTGMSLNSRYNTRYFQGSYRITTPTLTCIYRPTILPTTDRSLHCHIELRNAR
jgi:hypothetical protein